VQALSLAMTNALRPVAEKLDLLTAQQQNVVKSNPAIPVRRSIPPTADMQKDIHRPAAPAKPQSETPKLRAMIEQKFNQAHGLQ
jgi:hypothetical protein